MRGHIPIGVNATIEVEMRPEFCTGILFYFWDGKWKKAPEGSTVIIYGEKNDGRENETGRTHAHDG